MTMRAPVVMAYISTDVPEGETLDHYRRRTHPRRRPSLHVRVLRHLPTIRI